MWRAPDEGRAREPVILGRTTRIDDLPGGRRASNRRPERDEADLPAKQPQAEEDPWVPDPDADQERSPDPGQAPEQGPCASLRLIRTALVRILAVGTVGPVPSASFRIERAGRLRRWSDFERVRAKGRRLAGEWLVVHVLATEGSTRGGFVAGRGVGGAVERNRARRILKEAWRLLAPRARQGQDVLLVARAGVAEVGTPRVMTEMDRVLTTAGVLE